jgi:integrase
MSLRWDDLDLDSRLLRCRGTKSQKSNRTIELSEVTVSMLRAHKREQLEWRLGLGVLWKDHGLVFPSRVGTRWFRSPFYRSYKRLVNGSGLDDPDSITWHTLRHTAASQWIRHGVDIFTVSRRLGHASASFTMDVYGHLLKGQQGEAARALDGLLARA